MRPLQALDLNLLEPLYALLEEQHVSRAAARCNMSQPAMSRALDRLRAVLRDELLARSHGRYVRTVRGDRLLAELRDVLPRLETALLADHFQPSTSQRHFGVVTTDYAATILIPKLAARLSLTAPAVRLTVSSWDETSFANVESGSFDIGVTGIEECPSLEIERLFTDRFVCVTPDTRPPKSNQVTLEQYTADHHVVTTVKRGGQPLVDAVLAQASFKRRVLLRTPFALTSVLAAVEQDLICTTARRLALQLRPLANFRMLGAPEEFPEIVYGMVWHRRLADDPGHRWFRNEVRLMSATL